ncbi:uncharacterized protein LOC135388219 isoform X2 [Ornithodoros turicata]
MGDEVDIYSDLQNEEASSSTRPSVDAATELDLLDACVIPRQPTPVKARKTLTSSHSTPAGTVTRALELSSEKAKFQGLEEQNVKPEQPEGVCLEKEVADLRNQNSLLKHNISVLYVTAKHILAAKDKEIATLRTKLDNLIFRRNNRGSKSSTDQFQPANATISNPVSTQCILKDNPAGKASTQIDAEERTHEMSLGLQCLYELSRVPPLKRVELDDVRRLPHHNSELKQRDTKQNHVRAGGDNPSKELLVSTRISKSSATRNSSPIRNERYPPVRRSVECRQTEENTRLRAVVQKRKRLRSPTEPCPKKIGRSDHAPRGNRAGHSSAKETEHAFQEPHRVDHTTVRLRQTDHRPDRSSVKLKETDHASREHSADLPLKLRGTDHFSREHRADHSSVKLRETDHVSRELRPDHSCVKLKETGHASQEQHRADHSSAKLKDTDHVSRENYTVHPSVVPREKVHGDKVCRLRNGHIPKTLEVSSSSPLRDGTKKISARSSSIKSLSEKSCSLDDSANADLTSRIQPSTRQGSASKCVANGYKRNGCSVSPLHKSRRTSLRSVASTKYLHRGTSSDRSRLSCPLRSLDRERSRHPTNTRERVVRRGEESRTEKGHQAGIKCTAEDSMKGADQLEGRNGLRETKESPKLLTKRTSVEKDAEGTSSGIERDLEEGELVSD